MLVNIGLLVTRLDNEVVNVIPVQDAYTRVPIELDCDYLTDEDIKTYYKHLTTVAQDVRTRMARANGYLDDEQEAKDLPITLSRYKITFEEQQIEVK